MLIQLDALKTLPVAAIHDEGKVGTVTDVLIHPDTGELVGFWVQLDGWFAPKRALSCHDVIMYDAHAVIISSANTLLPSEEIVPFQAVDKSRDRWIGKVVETEEGDRLGRVTNLVINTDLEIIAKLYVSNLLGSERVISRTDIIRVTPKTIIVRANSEMTPEATPAAEEATA